MSSETVFHTFTLQIGGQTVGTLQHYASDQFFWLCRFLPVPAFEQFREVFDYERDVHGLYKLELSDEDRILVGAELGDLMDQIENMDIQMIDVPSQEIQEFAFLHIHGGEAHFRPL